jgi:hypothetical protein
MKDTEPEVIVADAAHASSDATVDAIEEAARVNEDPVVAEALDEAALNATTTQSRIGWLRDRVRRLFSR